MKFRKRRRRRPFFEKKKEKSSSWFGNNWWDIFGLFTSDQASEKSSTEEVSSFSILDPLGLFSTTQTSTSDENTVGYSFNLFFHNFISYWLFHIM